MPNYETHLASRYVRLSSKQRVSTGFDTNTDFIINLSNVTHTNNVSRVVVKSVHFPNLFYNVKAYGNVSDNSTLTYEVDGVEKTIVVPNGQYNITQLIAIIEPLITADLNAANAGSSVVITVDPVTNKLLFTLAGASTLKLLAQGNGITPSTLSDSLGIDEATEALGPTAVTFSAQGIVMLNGTIGVYVKARGLVSTNMVDGNGEIFDYATGMIEVDEEFGVYKHYHSRDDELDGYNILGRPENIDRVELSLVDDNDQPLVIESPKAEVTIVVKLYFRN